MILVTGSAPRSGTSAMMRALLKHYKPHSYAEQFPVYAAKERNPEGFWDIGLDHFGKETIPNEPGAVIKLWAPHFDKIDPADIDMIVWMERGDFKGHVESIARTAIAEGYTVDSHMISQMFINQRNGLMERFEDVRKEIVQMENFREDPDIFINHIREVVPWHSSSV